MVIYTKKRSCVLGNRSGPPCKEAVTTDVASGNETDRGGKLPWGNKTDAGERVPESFVTSGGVSTLETTAQRKVDERVVGGQIGGGGDSMVGIPPAEDLFGRNYIAKQGTKYSPSKSVKTYLNDFFKLKSPAHLVLSHPITSCCCGSKDPVCPSRWIRGVVSVLQHA